MNTQESFELICEALNFSENSGLKSVNKDVDKIEYGRVLKEAKEKFGIDEVYFVKTSPEAASIPVIYFKRLESVDPDTIMELHRRVWNHGKVPLLFIILPGEVKIYNTTTPPAQKNEELEKEEYLIDSLKKLTNVQEIRKKLKDFSCSEIETGHYWYKHGDNFKQENRVDQQLLKNLKTIRNLLLNKGLDYKHIHSLIGRSIFILYLQDRHALEENFFQEFGNYKNFLDILNSKEDTYNLFERIGNHFNGDMFPVSDDEKNAVNEAHLSLLHKFFLGTDLNNGQTQLWPFCFDIIPIELISCIYEEFFHKEKGIKKEEKEGTYYTPQLLVEFILDEILPRESKEIGIKILDPACGSGIFLVEAYRRLIERWRESNSIKDMNVSELFSELEKILNSSIYGVDINEEAIRVAAFSLYLTMLDFLEPKTIWQNVKFPTLIGSNLFIENFFNDGYLFSWDYVTQRDRKKLLKFLENDLKIDWAKNAKIKRANDTRIVIKKDENSIILNLNKPENKFIIKTDDGSTFEYALKEENGNLNIYNNCLGFKFNKDKFDIIVGNPPWKKSKDKFMLDYCRSKEKPIGDKQIAQAFLWKALECCSEGGEIGLLVTAKGLLFDRSDKNRGFRKYFFRNANVSTIVNFSILRRELFNKGIGPPAAVFYKPIIEENAKNKFILYVVPKPSAESKRLNAVVIDPSDLKRLPLREVIDNDIIWKVAMWGTPRDYELIKRLTKYSSLKKMCDKEGWKYGKGFILGRYLFSLGLDYKQNLITGSVNKTLRTAFNNNNLPLSNEASITQGDEKYWRIKDRKRIYTIEENSTKLSIYLGDYIPSLSEKPHIDTEKLQRFAMNEDALETLGETHFNSCLKTKPEVFQGPHLVVNKSPKVNKQEPKREIRLVAALLKNDTIFTQAIFGIHGKEGDLNKLVKCCLILNTKIALYHQMLISSNWLVERDIIENNEILNIPIPEDRITQNINYDFLKKLSENPNADEVVNDIVSDWYDLDESETILVNDAISCTLDSFLRKDKSIAYRQVKDSTTLKEYARTFCDTIDPILKKQGKSLKALIYSGNLLLNVVSFELKNLSDSSEKFKVNRTSEELQKVLTDLDKYLLEKHSLGIYMKRNVRIYQGDTIHIVKLNERRYWTKSVALNDADETIAENILQGFKNEC